jgi:excisionase family DNA binding protein
LDTLLTVEQAAERLGTTERFVRRLVFERRIAYVSSAATSASLTAT